MYMTWGGAPVVKNSDNGILASNTVLENVCRLVVLSMIMKSIFLCLVCLLFLDLIRFVNDTITG